MIPQKKANKLTIYFLEWICENQELFYNSCSRFDEIPTTKDSIKMISELKTNHFYHCIIYYLMECEFDPILSKAVKKLLIQNLIDTIKQKGCNSICKKLITYIKEEENKKNFTSMQ